MNRVSRNTLIAAIACAALGLVLLVRLIFVSRDDQSEASMSYHVAAEVTRKTKIPRNASKPDDGTPDRRSSDTRRSVTPTAETTSASLTSLDHPLTASLDNDPYIDPALVGTEAGFDPTSTFAEAAQEFDVPAGLLKAIAYVQTRASHNAGVASSSGGRGVMGLRSNSENPMVQQSAQMLGLDENAVVRDPVQNIRAAAALLKSYAGTSSHDRPIAWRQAVERFSAMPAEQARQFGDDVAAILHEGLEYDTAEGRLHIESSQQDLMDGKTK